MRDWTFLPPGLPLFPSPGQNPQSHTNLEGWPARHKLDPVSVHDLSWVSEKACSHPGGSQPTGTTGGKDVAHPITDTAKLHGYDSK